MTRLTRGRWRGTKTLGQISAATTDGNKKRLRVLVVVEDEALTEAICLVLTTYGHQALAVRRSDDMATAIACFTPQAVVVDSEPRHGIGREVAASLQALASRSSMCVVALSNSANGPEDQTFFDQWLLQPVSSQDLLAALDAPKPI